MARPLFSSPSLKQFLRQQESLLATLNLFLRNTDRYFYSSQVSLTPSAAIYLTTNLVLLQTMFLTFTSSPGFM